MNIPARVAMKKCLIAMLNNNLHRQRMLMKVTNLTDDFETATVLNNGQVEMISADLLIMEDDNEKQEIQEVKNRGCNAQAVEKIRSTRCSFRRSTDSIH